MASIAMAASSPFICRGVDLSAKSFAGEKINATVLSKQPATTCQRVTIMKYLEGTVVSTAPSKTAIVEVSRVYMHPRYKKNVRSSKRYPTHDETDQCEVGDFVSIKATAPKSKTKRFELVEIIRRTPKAAVTAVPGELEPTLNF